MRFFANENVPVASVRLLREFGYDVLSVQETMPAASDNDVLAFAHENELIVPTFDSDYGELIYHHKLPVPASVIYFRFVPRTPTESAILLDTLLQNTSLQWQDLFTVVRRERIRQRPLP